MYVSLWSSIFSFSVFVSGQDPTDDYLENMMSEAHGQMNFTMFLTIFGEKLNGEHAGSLFSGAMTSSSMEVKAYTPLLNVYM